MILCNRCGNEFSYGRKVYNEATGKNMIQCPYCRQYNDPQFQTVQKKGYNKQHKAKK